MYRTLFTLPLLAVIQSADASPLVMLAENYQQQNIRGWLASEKLDGIRGYWTGRQLLSRSGRPLQADAFTAGFPPFALDGELWLGRGQFAAASGQIRRGSFAGITLQVFDVPDAAGSLPERLAVLEKWLKSHPNPRIQILPQIPISGIQQARQQLAAIEAQGGEGIMLRNPDAPYERRRSSAMLKLKSFHDAECTVAAHLAGAGKNQDKLGALLCRLPDGRLIKIGSGFTDAERANPPAIGSIITYRYQGFTKTGLPRFAVFHRKHQAH